MKMRKRKILGLILAAILAIALIVAGYSYFKLTKIKNDLNQFSAKIAETENLLGQTEIKKANDQLTLANQFFTSAYQTEKELSFLRKVPYLGHEIKIGDQIFSSAEKYLTTTGDFLTNLSGWEDKLKSTDSREAALEFLSQENPAIEKFNRQVSALNEEFNQIPAFYSPLLFQKQTRIRNMVNASKKMSQNLFLLARILPDFAGLNQPKTYLLIYQNNNEIRPTGGIISSYSIAQFSNGDLKILKTADVNEVKNISPKKITPPAALNKYWVENDDWPFGESNWNPDFSLASAEIEKTFLAAGGTTTNGIIALDPEFVRQFLTITGPIKLENYPYTFDQNNMLDTLQKHVEIDYQTMGIPFANRKKIIGELSAEVLNKTLNQPLIGWIKMLNIFQTELDEKHLLLFSEDQKLENIFKEKNWAGEIKKTDSDYLAIIDANFGGWKSNRVLEQKIDYQVESKNNQAIGHLKIDYEHRGDFDWRTSYYKTYTRVFLPLGAKLIDNSGGVAWETSEENDKTIFAGYFIVEPKTTKTIELTYELPAKINDQIENKDYALIVQKQAGTDGFPLMVNINNLKKFKTNLEIDREFGLE